MNTRIELPWNRYALIVSLAALARGVQFGKTALEKMVYMLQEIYGVDTGYTFRLHTYGPFSSQLLTDLETLSNLDAVSVSYGARGGGFQILPSSNSEAVLEAGRTLLDKWESSILKGVQEFGHMTAKELELRSTIVYVQRDLIGSGKKPQRYAIIDIVNKIKPKFSSDAIGSVVDELHSRGLLEVVNPG